MGDNSIGRHFKPILLRGRQEIANFLGYNVKTVTQLIKKGKLPVYKDPMGRWCLSNMDYFASLVRYERVEKGLTMNEIHNNIQISFCLTAWPGAARRGLAPGSIQLDSGHFLFKGRLGHGQGS